MVFAIYLVEKVFAFMRVSNDISSDFMKKAYETVLIIEDDADLRRLLESILTPYIKKVASGETLQSGWNAVTNIQPDLILLDNNLPCAPHSQRRVNDTPSCL